VTANAPVTVASPDSGGDATSDGGTATAAPPEDGGPGGDQDTGESTGALQILPPRLTPGLAADTPVTGNAPITILSPGSGGDSTGPGGETPPGDDTPSGPDGDTPTGPDSPPQGSSPPGDGSDDDDAGAGGGGGGPDDGTPSRGRQGEFGENPGSGTVTTREFGAPAGDLPFTGLMLWLVALLGAFALALGTGGRRLTTA
jgi:hypothetical protein